MDQAALSTKLPWDSSPGGNSSSDEESCPIRRINKKVVADAMKKKNTPGAKALRLRNEEIYGKTKRSSAAPPVESSRQNKKKKALPERTSGGGGKSPNYSEDEDFFISCAYVNVSVDPIKGVGQKADTFWTRVHEKFLIAEAFLRP
jgi:hypothetical protein